LLDTVLQDKMFETLLQIIVEQDAPLHAVPVTDVVTAFVTDGGEALVAKHCLKLLSKVRYNALQLLLTIHSLCVVRDDIAHCFSKLL
jgi:hypothetical protein